MELWNYGTMELTDPDNGNFMVNGHWLKRYLGCEIDHERKNALFS